MKSLAEARMYIDSFARPEGMNSYSWRAVKRLALYAWECYLEGRRFNHRVNFMCREFYLMVRDADGRFIIPRNRMHHDHAI